MRRKAALVAYDISCSKRRRRLFRCLQSWSLDAQYSVFECQLTQREAEELFLQLSELIDPLDDALMLVWLDAYRHAEALTDAAAISFKTPAWYMG